MNGVRPLGLSLALDEYDHTRDVVSGRVPVEGVELTAMSLPIEEIFYRFTKFREFVAIPVFVSRAFRHSSIYVREDSTLKDPAELRGARIGIPEWAQTASIYSRGMLVHEYGVPLESVDWVQAGVNQPGRVEKVSLKLPSGVRYRTAPDRSLDAMLRAGELDAVLSARPPASVGAGLRRLFPDARPHEEAYYRKTGIYPIMHVLALRGPVFERHPWVAMNLYKAFDEARRRSIARLSDITASRAPMPWLFDTASRLQALFGGDFYPYGLEPNRRTLEAFLQYAWEQGVCHRRLAPEELFPEQVLSTARV